MPISPGEHADLLRAIGHLLDKEGAEGVRLVNNEAYLTVSWQTRSGVTQQRHYQDHNLDELRTWARDSRAEIHQGPPGRLAELLRTLGQDLDRERADFTQIVQEADGLAVSGSIGGRYVREKYRESDLRSSSQRRQAARRGAPGSDSVASGGVPREPTNARWPGGANTDHGPLARRLGR